MTTADHGMPPRQPDENEPACPPARDILDFIDETVARITDADVDERLRNVLIQAGCRSRHAGAAPTPPQSGDRPAAASRRRSLSGFLTALSGADREILDLVPAERGKFARLGSTALIAGGIAAVSMWFALAVPMGINVILAAPVALLWALAVTGINRWLVGSMPVSSTWRMLAIAAPRLALALLLGALLSAPLVLATFQQPINTEIAAIKNQQRIEFFATPQRMQLSSKEDDLEGQIQNLDQVIASHGQVKVTLSADPRGQALNAQLSSKITLALEYYQQAECEGFTHTGCEKAESEAGFVTAWNSWDRTSAQVNDLANQVLARIDQLNAASAPAAVQQAQEDLPVATSKLKAAQARVNVLDSLHARQDSADNGALIRLEALDRLTASDSAIKVACLTAFLLFLVIECLPVTAKLLQRPGDYERILARKIIDEHLRPPAAAQEQVRLQRQAAGQEEHSLAAPKPQDAMPAQASSATEPLTVPEHLREQIDSISPFMKDPGETTPPAYREELENCFFAISQAVDELRRKGFDSDQITEALRVTADIATRQLAAAWQADTDRSALIRK